MLEHARFLASTALKLGANALETLPFAKALPVRVTRWVWIQTAAAIAPVEAARPLNTPGRPARPMPTTNDASEATESPSASANPVETQITTEALKKLLDSEDPPILLDVREPQETVFGIIPNAKLIPMRSVLEMIGELRDGKKRVVVYCASGQRSANVATQLRDRGLTALSLIGGIAAWDSSGGATARPPG